MKNSPHFGITKTVSQPPTAVIFGEVERTSLDLINEFRAVAGKEHQNLVSDLFEKITVFDLAVTDTSVREV